MSVCLINRYRGLAVLVRSYRFIFMRETARCVGHRSVQSECIFLPNKKRPEGRFFIT